MKDKSSSLNFIEEIISEDIKTRKHSSVVTRFPPEPNGYLHIGHSKAICINFGMTERFGGKTNLRFDDTNPTSEDISYVNAIKKDIKWLGYKWDGDVLYTSDYFDTLYEYAEELIKKGLAYVDDNSFEVINKQKGTPDKPGIESTYRTRSVEENLDLFRRMKEGEFPDGFCVLRAKIDMNSPNMHMRDPILYRIKHERHHRTGDKWKIYPMYDFAHGQSDSIEKVTHSLCSLEFMNHRPLYNWFIDKLDIFPSRQIEFARLNINYTVLSKRKLLKLVEGGYVTGWDDPRMPTISGLRRRGYSPESIKDFTHRVGVAKRENLIDISLLEYSVRDHLNKVAIRVMGVIHPLKVTITNYPEGKVEWMSMENNPEEEHSDVHKMPFQREIFIEKTDFMIDPPKKYFRMYPGSDTRLKSGYILHCEEYKTDNNGEVVEVFCTYYPDSKSGSDTSGIRAKGTLHWVSVAHAVDAEIRLYDRLFLDEKPDGHEEKDFTEFINPNSLKIITNAKLEPFLREAKVGQYFQFMRRGYYVLDCDATADNLIFNRTVTLKDTWKKIKKNQKNK